MGAVVKYAFTITNTDGPNLVTGDNITIVIAPATARSAATVDNLSCTSNATGTPSIAVNLGSSGILQQVGHQVASGDVLSCSFTTIVVKGDLTNGSTNGTLPAFMVTAFFNCSNCDNNQSVDSGPLGSVNLSTIAIQAVPLPSVTEGNYSLSTNSPVGSHSGEHPLCDLIIGVSCTRILSGRFVVMKCRPDSIAGMFYLHLSCKYHVRMLAQVVTGCLTPLLQPWSVYEVSLADLGLHLIDTRTFRAQSAL